MIKDKTYVYYSPRTNSIILAYSCTDKHGIRKHILYNANSPFIGFSLNMPIEPFLKHYFIKLGRL